MRKWIDLDAEYVLRALHDNSGLTESELYNLCGFGQFPFGREMSLYNCLYTLAKAGLITMDGVPDTELKNNFREVTDNNRNAKFRVSDNWIIAEMIIKRRFLGSPKPDNGFSTFVLPYFSKPENPLQQTDIFVLMPSGQTYDFIYQNHVINISPKLGLTISKAENINSSGDTIFGVWAGIFGAGVIIADCTERSPDVFYETGIAHTLGKNLIIVTQNDNDVPEYTQGIRKIRYSLTSKGLDELEQVLERSIRTILHLEQWEVDRLVENLSGEKSYTSANQKPQRKTQNHIKVLVNIKQKRLQKLEMQAAKYGLDCPAHITIEIEELREEVQQLQDKS